MVKKFYFKKLKLSFDLIFKSNVLTKAGRFYSCLSNLNKLNKFSPHAQIKINKIGKILKFRLN